MAGKDKRAQEQAPTKAFKNNPFATLLAAEVAESKDSKVDPATPTAPAAEAAPPRPHKSRGRLVLRRETKHRAGRAAIVIAGFSELRDFDAKATDALAKELKQALGCGGTVELNKGLREIVLQGDKAAKVAELLRARGFRVDGVTS